MNQGGGRGGGIYCGLFFLTVLVDAGSGIPVNDGILIDGATPGIEADGCGVGTLDVGLDDVLGGPDIGGVGDKGCNVDVAEGLVPELLDVVVNAFPVGGGGGNACGPLSRSVFLLIHRFCSGS